MTCYNKENVDWYVLQDFTEIADMAARGDHSKLDILMEDLKLKESEDVNDIYSTLPDFFTSYSFGKGHETIYDGNTFKCFTSKLK